MYDPNDTIEIEIKGVGKFNCRYLTQRQVKDVARLAQDTQGTLEDHHERLNQAIAIGLVGVDADNLTLAQKIRIVEDYPWAQTTAELKRLGEASASQSA